MLFNSLNGKAGNILKFEIGFLADNKKQSLFLHYKLSVEPSDPTNFSNVASMISDSYPPTTAVVHKGSIPKHFPVVIKPLQPLPPDASIRAPTQNTVPLLKRINLLLFPVTYPPAFYDSILKEPENQILTRLAFWGDECIGGIRCRLELEETAVSLLESAEGVEGVTAIAYSDPFAVRTVSTSTIRRVYIMTLAVLAPYRSLAVGSHLIDYIVNDAAKSTLINADEVYAHVWVANTDAMEFYKRRGFDVDSGPVIEGYYRRLKPNSAKVVIKAL